MISDDGRTWDEQSKDFELLGKRKGKYGEDKCICGHNIEQLYDVINTKTKENFILGSECIKNYKDGVFKHNKTIITGLTELQKIKCDICNIKVGNIKTHNKSKKHINNVKKIEEEKRIQELKKKYRRCNKCYTYNIPLNKPANYKYCLDCFKINNEEYKKKMNIYNRRKLDEQKINDELKKLILDISDDI
jgi:hypothetical protein